MTPVKVYRIVASGDSPFCVVVEEGGPVLSEGMDLRNEREALAFLRTTAYEEGLILNIARTPEGKIERIEGRRVPPDLRFGVDSLHEIEFIKSIIAKALRYRAAERAAQAGRLLVTNDDVRASLTDALTDVSREGVDAPQGI